MAFFRDFVVHTPEEIERIRVAMQMTAQVRDQLVELVRPGMSTLQIDMLAGDLIQAAGGTSGFLHKAVCQTFLGPIHAIRQRRQFQLSARKARPHSGCGNQG